jgi:hypothetical protein
MIGTRMRRIVRRTRNLLRSSELRGRVELDKTTSLTVPDLWPLIGGFLDESLELLRVDFRESQSDLGKAQEGSESDELELHRCLR